MPTARLRPCLQENGQLALSAGSVQGLLGVVQGWGRGAQDPRLVALALEALVGAVHVLHASRTPHRGPELHALLEGYFRVLNADWPAAPGPEAVLVSLRVAMLGGPGPGPGGGLGGTGRTASGRGGRLTLLLHRRHPPDAGLRGPTGAAGHLPQQQLLRAPPPPHPEQQGGPGGGGRGAACGCPEATGPQTWGDQLVWCLRPRMALSPQEGVLP